MTADTPEEQPKLLSALACAWPAMILAALLLAPFLKTAFTIDDPLYLREARQILADPLHPQAFNVVWYKDLNLRASQILPGGVAYPYLLIPTALAGYAEWAGHLTQIFLLLAALFATALAALSLGLSQMQARLAAILTATCPAVLGMAGTVMPDIAAMLFTILGVERLIAWRRGQRWHRCALATCWLSLAALTRTHTILILGPAFIFLLDGITADEIRASFRRFPARFLPLLLVPVACFIVSRVTADSDSAGENILAEMLVSLTASGMFFRNCFAFFLHWVVVIPLTIPWLALRFHRLARRHPFITLIAALIGALLLSQEWGWVVLGTAATLFTFVDIARDAIRRRDRVQLALWLWLFPAIPVILYIQLPSKYLLPSVPAAVILVIRLIPQAGSRASRWLIPSLAAAGAVLGFLILLGNHDLAEAQRHAAATLIQPHVEKGERVWFSGHWGFQWYAERAGAWPATMLPPQPLSGDIVVVSSIDFPVFAREWTSPHTVLQRLIYVQPRTYRGYGIGRVMDPYAGAGFFSNFFGYLPWKWGAGRANYFEVWKVE